ncbi:hypothetical protein DA2_2774 [Desulfovibrio sp. A2]|nr:hypothetical protein DA2_2774 [Desulfovibrio sp. A2]
MRRCDDTAPVQAMPGGTQATGGRAFLPDAPRRATATPTPTRARIPHNATGHP